MESDKMKNRIRNNVRKCIALANIKEEIASEKLKRKKMLYKIIPSCSVAIICGLILVEQNNNLSIEEARINEIMVINEEMGDNENIAINTEIENRIVSEIEYSKNEEKKINTEKKIYNEDYEKKEKNKENTNKIEENVEYKLSDSNQKKTNKAENDSNTKLNIGEVLQKLDKNKIFYEKVTVSNNTMLAYKPTIENLYKNADVVIMGRYDSDLKIYTKGIKIYTQTKFNVSKVIKNRTKQDVSKNVIFNRSGGVLSLDKYIKDNSTISFNEFKDIKVNEQKEYYIIQEYGPENKLDFSQQSNDASEYMLFLKLSDNQFETCATYYGIRKISNNKLYDYDMNNYIEVSDNLISNELQ